MSSDPRLIEISDDEIELMDEQVPETPEMPNYETYSEPEDISIGPDGQPEETPSFPDTPEDHMVVDDTPTDLPAAPAPEPEEPVPQPTAEETRDVQEVPDQLLPPRKRLRTSARRWTFVRSAIKDWRNEEGNPSTFEVGESSRRSLPLPLTGEPIEDTIPLLVARSLHHDYQIEMIKSNVEEIRGFEEEVQTIGELHARITEAESRARAALDKAREAEHRAEMAERKAEQANLKAASVEQQIAELRQCTDSTLDLVALVVYIVLNYYVDWSMESII